MQRLPTRLLSTSYLPHASAWELRYRQRLYGVGGGGDSGRPCHVRETMRSDCSQPLRGTSISAPLALPWASMKLDILPRTPRCTGTCNRPGALVSPSRRLGVLGYPLRPTAPFGDTCAPGPWESPRLAFRSRWGIPRGLCAQGRLPGAGSASSSPWLPASGPAATAATRRQKLTLRSGGAVSQQPLGGLARSIEDPRETPHSHKAWQRWERVPTNARWAQSRVAEVGQVLSAAGRHPHP